MSGSHILDPQNLICLSVITSPNVLFSKVRLIPDSARSNISKEPIKSEYLCKNAKKKEFRDNWSYVSGRLLALPILIAIFVAVPILIAT